MQLKNVLILPIDYSKIEMFHYFLFSIICFLEHQLFNNSLKLLKIAMPIEIYHGGRIHMVPE
jgi:hypothetical protein